MSIRLLVNDYPHRSIALQSEESVLLFHHSINDKNGNESGSYFTDFEGYGGNSDYPQCSVELTDASNADLRDFKSLSSRPCYGCLGLIGLGPDVFICVITAIRQVATVRPGETASRIMSVEFRWCS